MNRNMSAFSNRRKLFVPNFQIESPPLHGIFDCKQLCTVWNRRWHPNLELFQANQIEEISLADEVDA